MNMSYCMFHNTTIDLDECLNVLEETDRLNHLSEIEKQCVIKLLTNQLERLNNIKELIESLYDRDINPEVVRKWLEQ